MLWAQPHAPEAALTLLIPRGAAGIRHIVAISFSTIVLLVIECFSYLQTIAAFASGGGSYMVASENLGREVGLFAAAVLMIDYVLGVAVGISAGIGALISAVPSLQPRFLYDQRAELLTALLLLRAEQGIVIINVLWYFAEE